MTRMGLESVRPVRHLLLRLGLPRSELGGRLAAASAVLCGQKYFSRDVTVPSEELATVRSRTFACSGVSVRHFRSSATVGAIWKNEDFNEHPRFLVVQPRIQPVSSLKAKLLEALRLADSLEDPRNGHEGKKLCREISPYVVVQNPSRVQAGAYFGPGTINTVLDHVHVASTKFPLQLFEDADFQRIMFDDDGFATVDHLLGKLDGIFVNAPLSGVQQRNLEDAWGKPVLDRIGLIIEIFGAHAQSKAAKLQVELASLNYYRSRLVRARGKAGGRLGFGVGGESEVVSARGRATGAIGGAGETEIQLQRRRISTRRHRLKLLLAEVDRTQTLHRVARIREGTRSGHGKRLPVVAVVGYTNAGKSSLVAALSRSDMYVDDKLFATLDTRSRRVILPSGRKVILSDTVGFISDLPIQLVEAFQATLKEHVIDSSAANASEQRWTVLEVLQQIGVSRYKMENCLIEVWNKIDLSGEEVVMTQIGDLLEGENTAGELFTGADSSHFAADGSMTRAVDRDTSDEESGTYGTEPVDVEWARESEDVDSVRVSVRTKTGLLELSRVLDRKIQSGFIEEGSLLPDREHINTGVEGKV